MSLSDWFPFNPTEYRRDTYHLCAAADGIYRRLIDEYMVTRAPLPDHDAALAGITRVSAQEWAEHRDVLRAFFRPRDGRLFHKRCEQELHAQRMRSASRSKSAKEAATIRWAKEKQKQRIEYEAHADRNADAMRLPATLQRKNSTLTTSVVGEREITPQQRVLAELMAETLGKPLPQAPSSQVQTPQATEKKPVASPELVNSLKRAGAV